MSAFARRRGEIMLPAPRQKAPQSSRRGTRRGRRGMARACAQAAAERAALTCSSRSGVPSAAGPRRSAAEQRDEFAPSYAEHGDFLRRRQLGTEAVLKRAETPQSKALCALTCNCWVEIDVMIPTAPLSILPSSERAAS
jgi:hypothetical protein